MLSVTIEESLQQGGRAGFLIVGGHGLAEFVLIGLFVLGLNQSPFSQWASVSVRIVGGAVLLIMGFNIFRCAFKDKVTLEFQKSLNPEQVLSISYLRPFKAGIIVSVANPTWVLWWFSIGALYVTEALRYGWLGLGFFYTGHILADLTWYVFVAFAVATGRRFLNPAAYRVILALCGLFLIGFASYFMVIGSRDLLSFF